MIAPENPRLAGFSNAELSAAVDLMEMPKKLTSEHFRLYIDASREYRLRRRKGTE